MTPDDVRARLHERLEKGDGDRPGGVRSAWPTISRRCLVVACWPWTCVTPSRWRSTSSRCTASTTGRSSYDNAKRRAGICRFAEQTLGLSAPLTAVHSEDDVRDTILHEIAHALVGPAHGHDATWRAMARRIGCSGSGASRPTRRPAGRVARHLPGRPHARAAPATGAGADLRPVLVGLRPRPHLHLDPPRQAGGAAPQLRGRAGPAAGGPAHGAAAGRARVRVTVERAPRDVGRVAKRGRTSTTSGGPCCGCRSPGSSRVTSATVVDPRRTRCPHGDPDRGSLDLDLSRGGRADPGSGSPRGPRRYPLPCSRDVARRASGQQRPQRRHQAGRSRP